MSDHAGAPAPGTDAATHARLYAFSHGTLLRNTEGVSAEESLRAPEAGGNCMNWVVGHLVDARNGLLALLGAPPALDDARLARYRRGGEPLRDPGEAIDWGVLRGAFDASQAPLLEALAAAPAARLAAPLPEDRNPFGVDSVGQMVAVLHFHETYHVGQLGLLRRLLGKEGAIR